MYMKLLKFLTAIATKNKELVMCQKELQYYTTWWFKWPPYLQKFFNTLISSCHYLEAVFDF